MPATVDESVPPDRKAPGCEAPSIAVATEASTVDRKSRSSPSSGAPVATG